MVPWLDPEVAPCSAIFASVPRSGQKCDHGLKFYRVEISLVMSSGGHTSLTLDDPVRKPHHGVLTDAH
jgi:hypothetical protein